MSQGLLTAAEVLEEVDRYCTPGIGPGYPPLAKVVRQKYLKSHKMPSVVLRDLHLEVVKITMYRRVP